MQDTDCIYMHSNTLILTQRRSYMSKTHKQLFLNAIVEVRSYSDRTWTYSDLSYITETCLHVNFMLIWSFLSIVRLLPNLSKACPVHDC